MAEELVWRIGGEAGHGIKAVGSTFARMCTAAGYHVFDEAEYPSLIRGGHNTLQVVASTEPVQAGREKIDLLVALNDETITRHIEELFPEGGLIFDSSHTKIDPKSLRTDIKIYAVPMAQLAAEFGGEIMRNTVALGASAALFECDFALITAALKQTFKGKNPEVLKQNALAAKAGFEYVQRSYPQHLKWKLQKHPTREHLYLTGNDALALGALRAGLNFYAAYPMTPASPLLEFFAEHASQFGILVKQTEDEIAAINMAIGAGFAGARAMVATSGGGFSLMVEALGLAGATETPIVINLGQRPGPSTGLPTWTEQGDLLFALHASQGDFPRAIVAPGDTKECFVETARAFNLAQQFGMPIFVITDKYLVESHHDTPPFDPSSAGYESPPRYVGTKKTEPFARYATSGSNTIAARPLPGQEGGIYLANSDEHDEFGYSNEEIAVRVAQMDRRMGKLTALEPLLPEPVVEGEQNAEINFVCWGSTKGPVRDAIGMLAQKGITANFLNLAWIQPFPTDAVNRFVHAAKTLVLVENNYSGQFGLLVQSHTAKKIPYRLLKYSGRQFYPEEIVKYVEGITHHG